MLPAGRTHCNLIFLRKKTASQWNENLDTLNKLESPRAPAITMKWKSGHSSLTSFSYHCRQYTLFTWVETRLTSQRGTYRVSLSTQHSLHSGRAKTEVRAIMIGRKGLGLEGGYAFFPTRLDPSCIFAHSSIFEPPKYGKSSSNACQLQKLQIFHFPFFCRWGEWKRKPIK